MRNECPSRINKIFLIAKIDEAQRQAMTLSRARTLLTILWWGLELSRWAPDNKVRIAPSIAQFTIRYFDQVKYSKCWNLSKRSLKNHSCIRLNRRNIIKHTGINRTTRSLNNFNNRISFILVVWYCWYHLKE